ncbi:MAG: membrane protein insertase YidC [Oscillospiraceae bacterium]
MELFAAILGKLLYICYSVVGDYLFSIAIFTLLSKIILLPVSIAVQKNSIKIVMLTPELNELKCEYYGDKDLINEKTLNLYKREKYSPFISLIPLVIQLALLMGVIEVVKNLSYSGLTEAQMISFGIDFMAVPSKIGGAYILFPFLAALSSLVMCLAQNRSQVLQAEQGNLNKYGMMIFSTLLSLYLGFFVNSAVALYWIFSNVFSTVQIYILNALINPKKYIDYEKLEQSKKRLEEIKKIGNRLTPEEKKRQHADYKRFFSIDNKHLVFYSESSGFYKYYRRMIEWLTSHSNVKIHYITNDPNDIIFEIAKTNKQILPYFIGENKLIPLFLKMEAKMVIMTVPDLDNFHIKRSYVDKNVEYVFMDHALSSINMLNRKGALDHYDTIFCAGQHVCDEVIATENLYDLPHKKLVECGYGLMEDLTESYNTWCAENGGRVCEDFILLAPSYQKDNILDSCLDTVVDGLKKCLKVIIRPHPQYVRRFPQKWHLIEEKYKDDPMVETQSDFSSNDTIYKAALVVTDWSNISYEFSFSTLRPALLVNTPMKVINPDYKDIGVEPIDISLRKKIGIEVSGKNEDEVYNAASKLINEKVISAEGLITVRDETLFNFMHSAEVGGKYILSKISKQ